MNSRPGVVAAAVIVLLIGCGPTAESLRNEPEAQLHAAESVEVAAGGHDSDGGLYVANPAIVWRIYGTDIPFEDVLLHFENELSEGGWTQGGTSSGIRTTEEHDAEAWHRGDRIVRLSHLRNPPTSVQSSFLTYYEVALIGQGLED